MIVKLTSARPVMGKRQVAPLGLLTAPTVAPAAAAPPSARSLGSTPETGSEKVTSIETLELFTTEPGDGERAVTVGAVVSAMLTQ